MAKNWWNFMRMSQNSHSKFDRIRKTARLPSKNCRLFWTLDAPPPPPQNRVQEAGGFKKDRVLFPPASFEKSRGSVQPWCAQAKKRPTLDERITERLSVSIDYLADLSPRFPPGWLYAVHGINRYFRWIRIRVVDGISGLPGLTGIIQVEVNCRNVHAIFSLKLCNRGDCEDLVNRFQPCTY